MKASWQYYRALADRREAERFKQEALRARTMKKARQALSLSRQALAEAVGTSVSLIYRVETGMTVPDDDTCQTIARVLQLDLPSKASPEKGERTR